MTLLKRRLIAIWTESSCIPESTIPLWGGFRGLTSALLVGPELNEDRNHNSYYYEQDI